MKSNLGYIAVLLFVFIVPALIAALTNNVGVFLSVLTLAGAVLVFGMLWATRDDTR